MIWTSKLRKGAYMPRWKANLFVYSTMQRIRVRYIYYTCFRYKKYSAMIQSSISCHSEYKVNGSRWGYAMGEMWVKVKKDMNLYLPVPWSAVSKNGVNEYIYIPALLGQGVACVTNTQILIYIVCRFYLRPLCVWVHPFTQLKVTLCLKVYCFLLLDFATVIHIYIPVLGGGEGGGCTLLLSLKPLFFLLNFCFHYHIPMTGKKERKMLIQCASYS